MFFFLVGALVPSPKDFTFSRGHWQAEDQLKPKYVCMDEWTDGWIDRYYRYIIGKGDLWGGSAGQDDCLQASGSEFSPWIQQAEGEPPSLRSPQPFMFALRCAQTNSFVKWKNRDWLLLLRIELFGLKKKDVSPLKSVCLPSWSVGREQGLWKA